MLREQKHESTYAHFVFQEDGWLLYSTIVVQYDLFRHPIDLTSTFTLSSGVKVKKQKRR